MVGAKVMQLLKRVAKWSHAIRLVLPLLLSKGRYTLLNKQIKEMESGEGQSYQTKSLSCQSDRHTLCDTTFSFIACVCYCHGNEI